MPLGTVHDISRLEYSKIKDLSNKIYDSLYKVDCKAEWITLIIKVKLKYFFVLIF